MRNSRGAPSSSAPTTKSSQSDPRTTPDHPIARLLFGALVAYVAWYIQFRLFRTNGVIWSLALCSPLVPILDRLMPGRRFSWAAAAALPLLPIPGRRRRTPSPAIAMERIHVS